MGYPAAEGELAQAAAPTTTETSESAVDQADHVGVQLDALAGMVARQGQPLSPVEDAEKAQPEPAPIEVVVADPPDSAAAEAEEPSSELAIKSNSEDTPAEADIDPLTAPLSAVTGAAAASEAGPAPTTEAVALEPTAQAPIDPVEVPVETRTVNELEPVAASDLPITGTAGRTTAMVRPTQLLIVATAALNLILVGLNAVLVTPSGSMTAVVLGVAFITLAVWTAAAVTFLHWVSRAHAHVAAMAASRQRHGASMSLIGWFIPVAGFLFGYRVLQDLWTGSDPATRNQADAAPAKVRTIDIWLLGIVTAAIFGYAMPLALGESALWGGLSALGLMVAALSLAATMGSISSWQLEQEHATVADGVMDAASGPVAAETEGTASAKPVGAPNQTPAPQPVSASAK